MRVRKSVILLALPMAACSARRPPLQANLALQTCQYGNRTYTVGENIGSIICGIDPRYSTIYPQWMPSDYLFPTHPL